MRIDKLELTNFRCFEHAEIEFAKRFTLLIGDNGSGKTAVLDGLAVAAGAFLLGIPDADSRGIKQVEVRRPEFEVGQQVVRESACPTIVKATGEIANLDRFFRWPLEWSRSLRGSNARTTRRDSYAVQLVAESLYDRVKQNLPVTLPVLGYYGTGRLWSVLRDVETEGPGPRSLGYYQCSNPASDLHRLFKWFKKNELAALQKRERRHVLEAVRKAIVSMIPDATGCRWDLDLDQIVLECENRGSAARLPFEFLSDGYRNLVGLAADVAYRMAALNPHLLAEVVALTPGIVLIDEIDLHLHPNWQRTVVDSLMKTFPRIQFVATTHSPFIIQSLYGRPDTRLWDLVKSEEVAIPSKSIEDIAEDNQGVELPQQSRRFLEKEAAAVEFFKILKQGAEAEPEEKARAKLRLDELLRPYSDDAAFQAFLKMERTASGIDEETGE